jgi:hypothetical protein
LTQCRLAQFGTWQHSLISVGQWFGPS